ncbi:PD40 domain-containing protein [Psychromonas ossibalaenae]|uniref:PD40 domain-containing protein n=1 Tax=Psychromonas ossibalaenae TaxID=444922 RepID=UPI000370BFB1|nr:PD40 domain-containing protein [Psychromonas ossibalaenae]
MIKNKSSWILTAALSGLCLSAPAVTANPVAWDQQEQVWLSQQSAHFTISFLDGHQLNAARALDIAERVHSELLPFFEKAPVDRTEIVLVDDYDFSNGWATPMPFAQIRLIMSPPEDVNDLEANDEWMHMLIRHEYVHIMHMELSGGAVSALRNVFGRNMFLFPHALTPSLLLEGLAVYLETNKELGYGRLQGSNYAMKMRMQVSGEQLKDLQQVAVASREWPLGSPYLYGAYFIEYLADTYGEDKLQLFLQNYSRKLLPYFLLNKSAKQVFGKDFLVLWSDYQSYLNKRFAEQINSLEQQAVVGNDLQKNVFLQVTAAGSNGLLVNRNNGEDRPDIAVLNLKEDKTSDWQTIVNSKGVTSISSYPNGGLAASRQISYADGRVLNDLFVYQNGNWKRLTQRQRFRKVAWMPGGKQLAASRKVDGLSELWMIDAQSGEKQTQLWRGEEGLVLGAFSVSPDGYYLAAAVKRPNQGWNLERLTLNRADKNYLHWQALTDSKAVENSPVFLPDGRIAFSADYDGVYNIYLLEPQSSTVTQWTRETGGAFAPQWQPGLGLVYQAYSTDGYVLRHIEQPQSLSVSAVDSYQGRYDYPDAVLEKSEKSEPQSYSPWSTLRPRTWLPILSFDDMSSRAGIIFNGSDALGRHNYQAAADWDFKNSLAAYNLNYQYDNRWLVSAQRSHSFTGFSENGRKEYRVTRDDIVTVQRRNIFTALEDNLRLHAGMVLDKESLVEEPNFSSIGQYRAADEALAGLALTFDNREGYLNVPGTGWGNYADLVVESNELFSGDYSGQKYQAQWLGTLDLPGRTTLTARLGFGYADSGAKAFKLGGYKTAEEALLFGRDSQALRGYDESVQQGDRYVVQRLEVNSWLGRVERNWSLFPVGLGDISGKLFVDSGAAWHDGQDVKQLTGIGGELTAELKLGYNITLPVTVGLAKGLDDKYGKYQGYMQLQVGF